ncbi:MAG: MFS transporter [Microscillaceae bacterium]
MEEITPKKNDARVLNAWASYDWANSVYNLTITVAIFPIFFDTATRLAFGGHYEGDRIVGGEIITFLGIEFIPSILYAYAIGFSFLVAAILSPLLSGIADYGGKKKLMMKFFTYLGSLACFGLFFFHGGNVEWGILCSVVASIGYSGAVVFYVSYLPEIATDDRLDSVSAKGFSMGFLGSVLQLLLSLVVIFNAPALGLDAGLATRLSFLFVAIWWVGFAQIAFYYLPQNPHHRHPEGNLFVKGFAELKKVYRQIGQLPNLRRFLFAFFFYSMGAQSIFLLASLFGEKMLHLPSYKLIGTILLLQLVGIGGAYFFAAISGRKGNKNTLIGMLIGWFFICALGYFIANEYHFYAMAGFFGFVMGGYHLSRSTYAKLIPEETEDTASFFSFYDVTEKLATALGPVSYGFIEYLTKDMRNSLVALGTYFIIGLVILWGVRIPRGEIQTETPTTS